MKKILFVVRGFKPDQSASGNLLSPLIDEVSLRHQVHILTITSNNLISTENIFRISIRRSHSLIKKGINILQRNFSTCFFDKEIKNKIQYQIENLDSIYKYDEIIAITYEEILALIDANIEFDKKNIFLLEKLPETSRLKFIKKIQKKSNNEKITFFINHCKRIFSLPIMFNELIKLNYTNIYELEHPMVRDLVKGSSDCKSFSMLYAGGLDNRQRNPRKVIDFLNRLSNTTDINVRFHSYGNSQSYLQSLSMKNFLFEGVIPSDELDFFYDNSQCLITIGNKDIDIFPSKLFDCLSRGIPIVHFAQHISDPYFDYLDNYKYAIIILYDELDDVKTLERFLEFKLYVQNNKPDFEYIKNKFYYCTPECNAKILESILFYD